MNIACGCVVTRLLLTNTTILSIIHHSFKPSNHSNSNFTLYAMPSTLQSIDKMHIHSIANHVVRGSLLFSQLRMIWGRLVACIAVSEENERVTVHVEALLCGTSCGTALQQLWLDCTALRRYWLCGTALQQLWLCGTALRRYWLCGTALRRYRGTSQQLWCQKYSIILVAFYRQCWKSPNFELRSLSPSGLKWEKLGLTCPYML